jgi:hypothetical protein
MAHRIHSAIPLRDVIQACDSSLSTCVTWLDTATCTQNKGAHLTRYASFGAHSSVGLTDNVLLYCGSFCAESGPCPLSQN